MSDTHENFIGWKNFQNVSSQNKVFTNWYLKAIIHLIKNSKNLNHPHQASPEQYEKNLIEIVEIKDSWVNIKTIYDGYYGFIDEKQYKEIKDECISSLWYLWWFVWFIFRL